MVQTNVAEVLLERVTRAARSRREKFESELTGEEFEKFMKAVERVGMLTITAAAEELDLGTMGMAMDYYSRCIRHLADDVQEKEVPRGS